MPRFVVLEGPDAGRRFELAGPAVTVGRHSTNPVPLTDPRVSRRHFEIRTTAAGGTELRDLGSGNGTEVNGREVRSVLLRHGDRVGVGDTLLRFEDDGPPSADRTRLVVRPTEFPSAILHSVSADLGSQILQRPDAAGTDWLRNRLAHLAVLYEASEVVSEVLDVDALLTRVVGLLVRTTDADHGGAVLLDPETGAAMPAAVVAKPGAEGEFVVSRTVMDHVLKEKLGVLVSDATTDARFRGESIARHQFREVVCVPMKGRHDTVGVIFLDTRASPSALSDDDSVTFTEDHLKLAVAVAHQAALAVEENRYYQAMLQSERLAAIGQTIAALSHHIKNIMQGVRFGSDMVKVGLVEEDRELLTKGWRLVEKNQTRIDELILDMLNYSKEREPVCDPTDLPSLVADVMEVVRGRAEDAGVVLEMTADPLAPVSCDAEGIRRAVLNVVSNAVDAVATTPAPRVAVTVRAADGFAEVVVADTGAGVPAEKREEIFKPFVSTKGNRGTGLGLPAARKSLREHGGDVTVRDGPAGGAEFVLRLPLQR